MIDEGGGGFGVEIWGIISCVPFIDGCRGIYLVSIAKGREFFHSLVRFGSVCLFCIYSCHSFFF